MSPVVLLQTITYTYQWVNWPLRLFCVKGKEKSEINWGILHLKHFPLCLRKHKLQVSRLLLWGLKQEDCMEYAWSMEPASAVCVCVCTRTHARRREERNWAAGTHHTCCVPSLDQSNTLSSLSFSYVKWDNRFGLQRSLTTIWILRESNFYFIYVFFKLWVMKWV